MKRLIIGLLLIVLLASTVACASARAPESTPSRVPAPAPAPPSPTSGSIFEGKGTATPPPVINLPPIPTPTPTPTPTPAPIPTDSGQSFTGERMIVRTGSMALVVVDVAQTIEQITKLAGNFEGFVVSSNSWQEGERLMGNISIRVPAERFDDAIGALRAMAVEVTSESTSGQDVTEEYVDLTAKLRNLEASRGAAAQADGERRAR